MIDGYTDLSLYAIISFANYRVDLSKIFHFFRSFAETQSFCATRNRAKPAVFFSNRRVFCTRWNAHFAVQDQAQ